MLPSSLLKKISASANDSRSFLLAAATNTQALPSSTNGYSALSDLPQDLARMPALPSPGQARKFLKLTDETLTHYGDAYLLFIEPWKHLVGTELPNFYQYIAWHEQAPALRH